MAAGALNLQPNVRDAGETRRPDLQLGHVCLLALNDAGPWLVFQFPQLAQACRHAGQWQTALSLLLMMRLGFEDPSPA